MNILLIHPFFVSAGGPGGARWSELCRHGVARGHTFTVVAAMIHYGTGQPPGTPPRRWAVEETDGPGVRVIRTYASRLYHRGWYGRLWSYLTWLVSAFGAALFRVRGGVDLVVATSPPLFTGALGVVLARLNKAPLVTEVRDLWPDAPVQMGVLTHPALVRAALAFERWLYRHSDRVVVLTPSFRSVLLREKGVAPDRLHVLPNGADFRITDPLLKTFSRVPFERRTGLRSAVFRVIYAGAHGRANGVQPLLEAARRLADEPVEFLLVGDGMDKKRLQRLAHAWKLTNVRFLGSVPRREAFQYVLASDLGVVCMQPLPVFRTMYATKMFEYMAARKPILLALDGVSRGLIEQAAAGTFVPPDQPDAWVRVIRQYCAHPERARQQGRNGYALAKAEFDRHVLADHYFDLLDDVQKRR